MKTLRLFYALNISSRIRDILTGYVDQLKTANADVKWVESQNIHLTLKFLGETPEEILESLIVAGNAIGMDVSPFNVFWNNFGAFPDVKRPRIIWAGILKGDDYLKLINGMLEDSMVNFGYPRENRNFNPHLTIGRVRTSRDIGKLLKILERIQGNRIGEMNVKSFSLMISTLTPKGPIYKEAARFELNGKKDS